MTKNIKACSKTAFTLAEVLITLGIIGIVAAMTLPSLLADYRNRVVETRLKKFYTVMNQAILQSVNVNGDYMNWSSYFLYNAADEDGNYISQVDKTDALFEEYLAPYLKIVEKKEVTMSGKKNYLYFFADGSSFYFSYSTNKDIYFMPKNGVKCLEKTHRCGICSWLFLFNPRDKSSVYKYHYKKGIEPYKYNWDGDISTLYNKCSLTGESGSGYCTALIQQNGWKVPDDYPKKISY